MRAERKHIRFGFLIILALVSFHAETAAKRLPIKTYTSADGLGSGFVDHIYRDSRGFMWFCTRDGLSRFDGTRFITFRVGDENAAPGIENIFETREGIYYVTTTGGTYRFAPEDLSTPVNGIPQLNATLVSGWRGELIQDRNGVVWMGSGGLFRRDIVDGKDTFNEVDLGLPPNPNTTFIIYELAQAEDGSMWLHNSWGILRILPDGRKLYYTHDRTVTGGATSMLSDKTGRIWLSRGSELLSFKPEAIETITDAAPIIERSLKPTLTVDLVLGSPLALPTAGGDVYEYKNLEVIGRWASKRFFQSKDGSIWISAENTLLRITGQVPELYTDSEGLPTVMARMAEDEAGNLWIVAHSGLARLDRAGLISYGKQDGLNSARFFSINESPDGKLYFGQRGFYWSSFDGEEFRTARPGIDTAASPLWTSRFGFLSTTGELWMLTNSKLYRFADGTDVAGLDGRSATKTYTTADGVKSDAFFQIYEEPGGDIWVSTRGTSTEGHGLARLRKGGTEFNAFSKAEGFPDGKTASAYAKDTFGNIWISFYEGGMARFDGERFAVFTKDDGLPVNGHISDIHVDRKGVLWLASSVQGLYRVENVNAAKPLFQNIKIESGKVSSNIRTLTEDRFGRLYLGTARGVDRYSPETGFVKHYSVSDGLAADFVVDSYCDRKGDLWFATNDGVSRLTPLPDEKTAPPRVYIGGLRIGDKVQPVSNLGNISIDKGELSYLDNNFQIDFIGLDVRAGEALRFQYKLDGANSEWSDPTDLSTVTYANLRPGAYGFQVRAINSEGVISETPASVAFTIVPPIWQRWWFLILAVIAVGLVILLLIRYRTARLMEINAALENAHKAEERLRRSREDRLAELERVRSRIATDLHDDIGASLTQIAVLSEVAQTQKGSGNGAASEPLTRITEVSNQLVGTMSDIVWSINPSKDHLSDLAQRMRRFAADVLAPKNVIVRFALPEDGGEIVLNSNVRREVFLVFKEAVNNISKHAEATEVNVSLGITTIEVSLEISDNGIGFENVPPSFEDTFSSEGYSGNGIPSMHKRAAEMDGRFEIVSGIGKGTTIYLRLPRELAFDDSMIPNSSERRK